MASTEITLLSTTAMKTAVDELTAQIERATGRKLVASYAPSAQIAKRIAEGEAGDVALVTGPGIEQLIKPGRVFAVSCIDVARSTIGVAVPPITRRRDVPSAAAALESLLNARSIAMCN